MAKDTLTEQTESFVTEAFDKAGAALDGARKSIAGRLEDLGGAWQPMGRQLAEQCRSGFETLQARVRRNPGSALCVGVLAGMVVGFLARGED